MRNVFWYCCAQNFFDVKEKQCIMTKPKRKYNSTELATSASLQARQRVEAPAQGSTEVPAVQPTDLYNSVDYCLNCRRSNIEDTNNGIVFTECTMCKSMLKRKFCLVDSELYKRHQNAEKLLKAKLCMECSRYMRKESRLPSGAENQDWSIVWPAFMWQILMSPTISAKLGIKIWCIVPHEWRIWWLSQFRILFNNLYAEASISYPKQVIRDLTERKAQAKKLISDLKIFDIVREWDNVLKCTVACPFGCSEFVHKTKSLPLDIVIARALEFTDKDMAFVTPNPALMIDYMLRGMRNDYLTFPMSHVVSKLNNPDPEWEILPGVAFINEEPEIQVCRSCGNGSKLHFLYPPRNPFPMIPSPPYGEQLSPVAVRCNVLKTARASKYSDRHQMLHLQGHVNGVNTIRVTTEKQEIQENQMSIPFDCLALKGREDIKAHVLDMMSKDSPMMTQESGDYLFDLAEETIGDLEKYKDFYESATYIDVDVALKLEMDGKMRRKQCYIAPTSRNTENVGDQNGPSTTTTAHFISAWPRIIPYVHAYNNYGCKFPSLYTSRSKLTEIERILWCVSGVVAMIQPIWDKLALAELYSVIEIDGYFLSFVSKICFPHLSHYISSNYPFKFDGYRNMLSERARYGLCDQFRTFGADTNDCVSVLNLVLKNATNATRIGLPTERIDLDELFIIGELQNRDCLVCTTKNGIEYDISNNTKWQLRFVCGEMGGKQHIYVRHGGEYLSEWWHVQSDTKFVTKANGLVDLSLLYNDIIVVFAKNKIYDYNEMRGHFLASIGGQSFVYCANHKKPLVVHAKIDKVMEANEALENETRTRRTQNRTVSTEENPLQCCYNNQSTEPCSKRISYCCPMEHCYVCICSKHIKEATNDAKGNAEKKIHIGKVVENLEHEEMDEEIDYVSVITNLHETMMNVDNEEPATRYPMIDLDATKYIGTFDGENKLEETEEENQLVDVYCDLGEVDSNDINSLIQEDVPPDDPNNQFSFGPSTTASIWKPTVCKFKHNVVAVNGAVILNHCGTLLARGYRKLEPSIWQGNFLQTLIATIPGRSIPLLYAEGTLFPRIFWKDDNRCAIIGAIPTALLASDQTLSSYGIASVPVHLKNRLKMGGDSLCCQSQDYLCYTYDSIANLSCRGEDTRLVLRQGGMTNNLSLKKENKSLMFDSDSIESRPHVNQLCAKMRDRGATYFGSHSANQHDHFGLKSIKEWIDSDELHKLTMNELLDHKCTSTETLQDQCKTSIMECSTIILLRHWQETTELYMNYICHSPEEPLGKVMHAWYRHEYQEAAGNLSHLHYLLWLDPCEDENTTLGRIRGSWLDFITPNEVQQFINDGMNIEDADVLKIQDLAERFLTHTCSSNRCMKRRGTDGKLQCRVSNNGLESPTPHKHVIIEVDVYHTEAASEILVQLGLMQKLDNGKFVPLTPALQGHKHYPPCRPADGKFSPCNNRLFAATMSNQNTVYVTGFFASRYVAKYSAKIDESTRVFIGAGQEEANTLTLDVQFLHNTKITGSKINEEKKMAKRKDKHHPTGRAISIMEMMQATLEYDTVYTNIVFLKLTSVPLGERAGFQMKRRAPK